MNSRNVFKTQNDLAQDPASFIKVPAKDIARIVSLKTSGTVMQKRVFFTENDLKRSLDFFMEGMSHICEKGDICGVLMPCGFNESVGGLLTKALSNIGCKVLPLGIPNNPFVFAEILEKKGAGVLIGFPWHVRLLSVINPSLKPKRILLSADYVPESLKKFLAERCGCEVLTHYGMTETGYGLAVQHPGDNFMTPRREDYDIKIIDPKSLEFNDAFCEGEIVISSKRSEAMSFQNYRTGDIGALDDRGNLLYIKGRADTPREFYELQEALAPIPWLYDYNVQTKEFFVSENAPQNCKSIISNEIRRIYHKNENTVNDISVIYRTSESAILIYPAKRYSFPSS